MGQAWRKGGKAAAPSGDLTYTSSDSHLVGTSDYQPCQPIDAAAITPRCEEASGDRCKERMEFPQPFSCRVVSYNDIKELPTRALGEYSKSLDRSPPFRY